jgi:hypothetical protein
MAYTMAACLCRFAAKGGSGEMQIPMRTRRIRPGQVVKELALSWR